MINIKSKKGITLVSLIVTVIILLIISGTAIYNYRSSNDVSYYNKMASDIKLLNDKILIYYNKYAKIPVTDRYMQIEIDEVGDIKYYEIDLAKLEGLSLNYGEDYGKGELTDTSDVYLINSNLHIYYMKGVKKDGELHYFTDENIKYASDIDEEIVELPEGCVELEYIESTGTQYINTLVKANDKTEIKCKFSCTGTGSAWIGIFGQRNGSDSNALNVWLYNGDYYAGVGSIFPKVYKNDNSDCDVILNSKNIIINGENVALNGEVGISNSNIFIFAIGTDENNTYNNKAYAKFYNFKIYEDGKLIRDYVPCKRNEDSAIGMYDLVEGEFYTNSGTGEFKPGPEV